MYTKGVKYRQRTLMIITNHLYQFDETTMQFCLSLLPIKTNYLQMRRSLIVLLITGCSLVTLGQQKEFKTELYMGVSLSTTETKVWFCAYQLSPGRSYR